MRDLANKNEREASAAHPATIAWLLREILRTPRVWIMLVSAFVVLSCVSLGYHTGGDWSFAFQTSGTTAIFLALLWLPALLKVFALIGGGVKTPAGEISSSGMTSLLQHLRLLDLDEPLVGTLIERASKVEAVGSGTTHDEVSRLRFELQEMYASSLSPAEVRAALNRLAQRYTEVRETMPYGWERTIAMESVVGGMRALEGRVRFSSHEVHSLLSSADGGERILGLSILGSSGRAECFTQVLTLLDGSFPRFEQYHALRALEPMVPHLDPREKRELLVILDTKRSDGSFEIGGDRWLLSGRIVSLLTEELYLP